MKFDLTALLASPTPAWPTRLLVGVGVAALSAGLRLMLDAAAPGLVLARKTLSLRLPFSRSATTTAVMERYEGDGAMTLTACGPNVVAFVLTGNDCAGAGTASST